MFLITWLLLMTNLSCINIHTICIKFLFRTVKLFVLHKVDDVTKWEIAQARSTYQQISWNNIQKHLLYEQCFLSTTYYLSLGRKVRDRREKNESSPQMTIFVTSTLLYVSFGAFTKEENCFRVMFFYFFMFYDSKLSEQFYLLGIWLFNGTSALL